MIYQLGAFQDPNLVPMAAFYGPTLSVNFLSKLAQDCSPQVHPASESGPNMKGYRQL